MISIVAATEQDIPKIMEIEREAISPPWSHGALLDEISRDDSFFAVAASKCGIRNSEFGIDNEGTYDGSFFQLLGFIILRRMADEGELLQIAVEKDARRRGVADMLMGAAIGFAAENTLNAVHLEVRKSNEAAIALYKKQGFSSVRHRRDYFDSPVEDAVVMSRELTGESR